MEYQPTWIRVSSYSRAEYYYSKVIYGCYVKSPNYICIVNIYSHTCTAVKLTQVVLFVCTWTILDLEVMAVN